MPPQNVPVNVDHTLLAFSNRWRLDGDYIRCVHCMRPCLASCAALPFEHREGCPNASAGDQHPWYELAVLLTKLPEHLPPKKHRHTLVYALGFDGVVCSHCDYKQPTVRG